MPGAEATQLTQLHRAETLATANLIADQVRSLGNSASTGDVDAWWRRVIDELVALVAAGWEAIRELAELYLVGHAAAEGRSIEPTLAVWNTEQVLTSLRVTGPVEFKRHVSISGDPALSRAVMSRTLAASSERLVLSGERDTVMQTVEDAGAIVGWRRVTDADPCAWCAMLASRGAMYQTSASAAQVVGRRGKTRGNRLLGESFHDGDECTVEPLYEHEDEPPEVAALFQQWKDATAGTSGKAAVREWRRYWDGRKK